MSLVQLYKNPIPITQQTWPEQIKPLVSISCITYNHENYIRDAIEGFLIQKTTFPVEILIHDDASTDNTANIIREYEAKYPQLIKPIYQTENQYSKKDGTIGRIQRGRARGKYYSTCEGDDYWTDPLKLQKQVDFLERNEEYSLCFHNAEIRFDDNKHKPHPFAKYSKNIYTIEDIINKAWFIPTQSIVYRKDMHSSPEWSKHVANGDYALQLLLAEKGSFYCINEIMSVYRKHGTSLNATHKRDYFPFKIIQILLYFDYYSNFKYKKIIWNRIEEIKSTIYKKNLYDRPLLNRLLSVDYYYFKFKSLVKN